MAQFYHSFVFLQLGMRVNDVRKFNMFVGLVPIFLHAEVKLFNLTDWYVTIPNFSLLTAKKIINDKFECMDNTIPLGALHVRVFLFRVILVSSLLKIILSNIYWHNKSYNLFKSNDIYYRSFQILKLTFLTLLSYFT